MALTPAPLPRSTPEAQGVSSTGILSYINALEASGLELHSLMVLRHGHVIAEGWWAPYAAQNRHLLYSLSKSFTSTAAGFAIQEGLFSLDDPVASFFPEDVPAEAIPHLQEMRVRDLLTMTSGHEEDTLRPIIASGDDNWIKWFLSLPVGRAPGTHFVYNTGATYMVAAIVQKTTGQTLLDYLEPRLFAPLGITDPHWKSCPRGVNVGGWGLSLKTEEIARFGQFYLQKGQWNGEQLLNPEWIEAATAGQAPTDRDAEGDWGQGYGFQFWRCRHNAYRGDGAFGQFCVVMPDQDTVVAITSNVNSMHDVLDLLWLHLLPACNATPLVADDASQSQLQARLNQLQVPLPHGRLNAGSRTSSLVPHVSGQRYRLAANDLGFETISFEFASDECTVTVQDAVGTHRFACGTTSWISQDTGFLQRRVWLETPRRDVWRLTARGVWIEENIFAIKLCFEETPFTPVMLCRFDTDRSLHLGLLGHIGFHAVEINDIMGQLL